MPAQVSFNFSNIASAINAAHAGVEAAKKEGSRAAVECGKLLHEAKATVPHGKWDAWVRQHCKFSLRTAQLYMRVATHVWTDPGKAQRVADLSLRDLDQQSRKVPAKAIRQALIIRDDDPATDGARIAYLFARFGGLQGTMKLLQAFDVGCSPKGIGRSIRQALEENPARRHELPDWAPILDMFERATAADAKAVIYAALAA